LSEPLVEVEFTRRSDAAHEDRSTLTFATGRLNTLMGPNGCGKTLLVTALAFRGELCGARIARSAPCGPGEIAYLPQRVRDTDDIALSGLLRLCSRATTRQAGERHLRRVARGHPRRSLEELSGGERRLLLFLAVAAQMRRVHIYDEPFQALDAEARGLVTLSLAELVQEGRLVIVVAHDGELCPRTPVPTRVLHLPWKLRQVVEA
jgi:ABC-type Mn2+/Zn2+ transport system ATPase subunit